MILNIVLVPIPSIGVNGAAWASVACHAVAFTIAITALVKHIKININLGKFVVKPALATIAMALCSKFVYNILSGVLPGKLVTLVAILVAIIIYLLAIALLKVFTKKEIVTLPMGAKILRFLEKIKIY